MTGLDPIIGKRAGAAGTKIWPAPSSRPMGQSGLWLRNAAIGLCVLAAAAAAVSFTAQYRMVDATRQLPVIAALEAAIPDTAALVFACLSIALALNGRRAIRARTLNLASVAASVFMNAIAAGPGWRNLAIWIMPPTAYALASDTLISVIRAWTAEQYPVAPGGHACRLAALSARPPRRGSAPLPQKTTKSARFLDLVAERHGSLGSIPLDATSRIASALSPEVGLNTGAARAALRKAVLAAQQDGDPR